MSEEKLWMITYLSPGISIELFHSILHYLEEVTGRHGYLITESRWSTPSPDRPDPFRRDADIGIMCSSGYLSMRSEKNPSIELCKAAPIHIHPGNGNRPVYYSDIVVSSDDKANYKAFHDLQGRTFAYNDPTSLSGSLIVLGNLKKMGYDSNFFGNIIHSGSHHNSIQMILDKKVDTAAIDSNVLFSYLKKNPHHKSKLTVIESFGPMPIYPIVFRSSLSAELKTKITEALLKMHTIPKWKTRLEENGVQMFSPVDESFYNMETEIMDVVKDLKVASAYY